MSIPSTRSVFDAAPQSETAAVLSQLKRKLCAESAETPVDIVFLTYNRRSYFEKTINALIHNTRYPYRLIIVDNNSDSEMLQYLWETSALYDHLILNDENYYTTAFQRGIACAASDPYIVSDPDILVPNLEGPCWLERLLGLHRTYPEMGLIALNLDAANKPAKLPDVYIGEKIIFNDEITLGNVGTVMQSIKRRFFDGRYLTDWDTCEQVRASGGKVGFASKIVAWHLGWDEDQDYPDYLLDKYEYYKQKYGAETYRMYTENEKLLAKMETTTCGADYYSFSRPDVQALVKPSSRRILDIGCGSGALGHELKQKLGAEVWGVECVSQAAKQAESCLDRVLAGTIEKMLPQVPDRYFDTIILADVLEHLVAPDVVLKELRCKLAEGGEIVASIPNVRHWSVIKQLLEGRWEYEDAGILDRTHLRFFTNMECLNLFKAAGYSVTCSKAMHLRDDETIPAGVVEALAHAGVQVGNLKEESTHYQYLFVASPAPASSGKQELRDATSGSVDEKESSSSHRGLTSIIILTWNQLEFTKACLASIARHTAEPYELIIVDNGSTDGTLTWLREQAASDGYITVIENATNRGFATGCNQGISRATGDFVLLLNNDTVVSPNWLAGLHEVLKRYPDAGIVGPMTDNASGVQVAPDSWGGGADSLDARAEAFREYYRYRIIPQRRIVGFCMLFRRGLVEMIGGMDETFGAGNYEDDDFCLRAELAGFRNLVAGDVFIRHEGGVTFAGNNMMRGIENRKNRAMFKHKWEPARLEKTLLRKWLVLDAIEKADILSQQEDFDGAVDTLLKRGITVDPDAPGSYFKLAEILIAAGRYEECLQVFPELPPAHDRFQIFDLEAVCHGALGDDCVAEQAAKRALEGPYKRPRALVVMGTLAARRADLQQAEALFRSAIEADPSSESGWLSLGMLQWGMGDQGGAWQAISRAVMVNPLNREAVRIYRDLAFRLDRTGDAIRLLSEASSIWFHSRALSLNHAEMLSECGFVAEARGACEKFLAHFRVDDTLLQLAGELQSRHHDGGSDAIPGVPMVSLCMIVKDEEKNLARCLASVKAVADDIVVVDTGSGDRTVDIARAYGARVFTFPWNGDFSAARNYSLSKAAGKWILVMDADEVLSERDYAVIGGMLEQSVDRPVAWSVITRNYTDRVESEGWQANDGYYAEQEKGDGWYPSRKVRLFPNSANIRFKGDIHEMVEADLKKSGISVEPAQIVVHHYGELEETDRRAKQLRYYEMGKQKLAFRPNDAASVTELAIQAGELELYGEALELWDLLIARGEITRDIYFNRSYALMGLKRFNEASEMACKALEIDPAHKESAYNYGICLLNQAKPEQALEVIEPYNVRYPEYPLLMALRCVLCLCLNVNEQAVQLYNELIARNYAISGYVLKRVAALESMGYCAMADRLRKTAAERKIIVGS